MYGAGAAWSYLFFPGAGADPSRSEPESAPGPRPSGAGAAQKSGGSATLQTSQFYLYVLSLFAGSGSRTIIPDPGKIPDPCGSGSATLN